MKDAKQVGGWIKCPPQPKGIPYTEAYTPLSTEKECWIILRGYSESELKIKELISRHQTQTVFNDTFFKGFKSFIRQAENFYKGASVVDFESKPLLLYYCYLNLSKALLMLKGKNYLSEQQVEVENHGISPDRDAMRQDDFHLNNQKVILKTSGVAVDLYKNETSISIDSQKTIPVQEFFLYIPEITYQVMRSNFGKVKFLPCQLRFISNPEKTKYWIMIAIQRLEQFGFDIARLTQFHNYSSSDYRCHIGRIEKLK